MQSVTTFVPKTQVVAACQFAPKLMDVQSNLATALQLAFEAMAKGAKLVVLPELATSGYNLHSVDEAARSCQTKDGYQSCAFEGLCRRFGAYVVFGYPEVSEGAFYNSAAMVGPGGLHGNWRKHNLHGNDHLWAQPSDQEPFTVLSPVGRTGVLICKDVCNHMRESYVFYKPGQRFYDKGSADTICVPTNWGCAFSFPDSAWVDLVEMTRANLVVANRVGDERDMKYKGGSCVIDRDRRIWTHGSSFTEAAVVGGVVVL